MTKENLIKVKELFEKRRTSNDLRELKKMKFHYPELFEKETIKKK